MAVSRKMSTPLVVKGVQIPRFVYGTAWKKNRTSDLVTEALRAGFSGIDTACQPKHYREDLVGKGIKRAIDQGLVTREALHVQTKFTSLLGQDPLNIPYDPTSPIEDQVKKSIITSLHHLRTGSVSPYIDTLILHSPLETMDLTLRAWRTLEQYVPHDIRSLGISNVDARTLKVLYETATIKPIIVQNRFYSSNLWDQDVRRFCKEEAILYQAFWILTASPQLMKSSPVSQVAHTIGISQAAALYLCVMDLGKISVLNGTTSEERMAEAFASVGAWDHWTAQEGNPERWASFMKEFQSSIGQDENSVRS